MKKERGIALVTVLILVLVFSVVGVAMMILSRRDVGESQRNRKLQMALAAAEAGIDQAIWELERADTWTGNAAPVIIGTPPDTTTFICSVDTTGLPTKQYAITCTGTATRAMNVSGGGSFEVNKRLKVLVEINLGLDIDEYALYTPTTLHTNGTMTIDGNVNAPTIDDNGNLTINGTVTDTTTMPDIDTGTLRTLAQSQVTYYTGDIIIGTGANKVPCGDLPATFWFDEPNRIPNVIYVEDIGAGASFDGGNCDFSGLLVVYTENPDLSLTGNQPKNGGAIVKGNPNNDIAVYCTGTYHGRGNDAAHGSIICGQARLGGGGQSGTPVEYVPEYASVWDDYVDYTPPPGGTTILSYQDISY